MVPHPGRYERRNLCPTGVVDADLDRAAVLERPRRLDPELRATLIRRLSALEQLSHATDSLQRGERRAAIAHLEGAGGALGCPASACEPHRPSPARIGPRDPERPMP